MRACLGLKAALCITATALPSVIAELIFHRREAAVRYLLLSADGAVLGDTLHAAAVDSAVALDLLDLLQREGDGDARHGHVRPTDVVLHNDDNESK